MEILGLLMPLIITLIIVGIIAAIFGVVSYIKRRKALKDPKSLAYALHYGDWSHWSSTELSIAYLMNPYIGDMRIQGELRKELDRRGIPH